MALHIALLDPRTPSICGGLARCCALQDASLHLVTPQFALDVPEFAAARGVDWAALDWWVHPGWRDFRDAMSRERCLYFARDVDRDPGEAPFRPNSVLVFGSESGELPERIREKYPSQTFGWPRGSDGRRITLVDAVAATLRVAAGDLGAESASSRRRSRTRERG